MPLPDNPSSHFRSAPLLRYAVPVALALYGAPNLGHAAEPEEVMACAHVFGHKTTHVLATPHVSPEQKPFFVDPDSNANRYLKEHPTLDSRAFAALTRIASQPTAKWFVDGPVEKIQGEVDAYMDKAEVAGAMPLMVIYNIPGRDAMGLSAGGVVTDEAYRSWIKEFRKGVGDREAVVILEPDALSFESLWEKAIPLLREAGKELKSGESKIKVFLDAGNPNWVLASNMAERLKSAGLGSGSADGFSINVSGFYPDEKCIAYGKEILRAFNNNPSITFIVDTSRNGGADQKEGARLGKNPTCNTGDPQIHSFSWIKPPGETDEPRNFADSPPGTFMLNEALALAGAYLSFPYYPEHFKIKFLKFTEIPLQ